MPNPALGASTVAWLSTDATAAENIANAFGAESEAAGLAVCRFEQPDGRWSLVLYFRDPPAEAAVRARVAASAGGDAARALVFETLSPADWVSKSREGLRPVVAGRFVVHNLLVTRIETKIGGEQLFLSGPNVGFTPAKVQQYPFKRGDGTCILRFKINEAHPPR